VLLRILLLGYLYGVTSERKLLEELRMHLAWRWFTGLGFDQEIPHHSTFSKNRHGRFQESKLFQELFERIVEQCIRAGLVEGEQMSVDEENGDGEPVHQQDKVSTTDPDATYMTKGNRAAELGYFDNYLIDNESCVIVGVQATGARLSQESAAARDMIDRYRERHGPTVKRCRGCSQKERCTRGKYRVVQIHICEPARQRAYALAKTPGFAISQRARRKVEALFSELKNQIGLRRLRLRRIKFVREQFYLAAVAQNLKRLVRFLSMRSEPAIASA
jgi:hypothetical protein